MTARDLTLYTAAPTDSIREVMEKIERNHHRAVVVVEEGKVLGTVTDGDIRRAFLHDVLPLAPVERIMHLNPLVTTSTDPEERRRRIVEEKITLLPVVSADMRLVDVELAFEPFEGS